MSVNNVELDEEPPITVTIQDSNNTSKVAKKYVDEVVKKMEQQPSTIQIPAKTVVIARNSD